MNTPHLLKSSIASGDNGTRMFWLIAVGMLLLGINMRAPLVALGAAAPLMQDALNLSESHIGWLGGLPLLMFALGSLISPSIGQRFGLERTLVAALLVLTLGIVLRSAWASWSGVLLGTLVFSLAIGFGNTLSIALIKRHVPNNIAFISGFYTLIMTLVAGGVAGIVYPLATGFGWQWALGFWAVFSVLGAAFWFWFHRRVAARSQAINTVAAGSTESFDQSCDQPHAQPHNLNHLVSQTAHDSPARAVWRSTLAWQLSVYRGFQSLLFYTMISFLPTILLAGGMQAVQAGTMVTIFLWIAPPTIMLVTWAMRCGVSDRQIAVVSALGNFFGAAGLALMPSSPAWLWAGLMGIGCAGMFTLSLILFAVRSNTPNQASQLTGMVQMVGYLIAFLGPLGAGWLHDHFGSWHVPLTVLAVLMGVNVLFAWLIGNPIMVDGEPLQTRTTAVTP